MRGVIRDGVVLLLREENPFHPVVLAPPRLAGLNLNLAHHHRFIDRNGRAHILRGAYEIEAPGIDQHPAHRGEHGIDVLLPGVRGIHDPVDLKLGDRIGIRIQVNVAVIRRTHQGGFVDQARILS